MDAKAIARCAQIKGLTEWEVQYVLDVLAGCPTGATPDALIRLSNCTTRAVAAVCGAAAIPGSNIECTVETLTHGQSRLRLKIMPTKH